MLRMNSEKPRFFSRAAIFLLNAGCAIYTSGNASSIEEGIEKAKESIDSGKALEKLNALIEFTNR